MSQLHLCNTFFELEMERSQLTSVPTLLHAHPAIQMLQYLPLLYAKEDELICVSKLPAQPDPRLIELNSAPSGTLDLWGASAAVKLWAEERKIACPMPPFSLAQTIQSKAFLHSLGLAPEGAALLYNLEQARDWLEKTPGLKVLKAIFSHSGRGHLHPEEKDPNPFLNEQFAANRAVVGEPWVDRVFDFSSQWSVGDEIELLGLTVFQTSKRGVYEATLAGPRELLFGAYQWAILPHLERAETVLRHVRSMGFFGNAGVDALIYRDKGKEKLRPIVEINARKTMSYIALVLQKQRAHRALLELRFTRGKEGLLPGNFQRNIAVKVL